LEATLFFTKLQGAGNDFVLIETADEERDWPILAMAICDRHFGVGGDGLLLLLPSKAADFKMRMFNPDGSEAEACGNGLRCLAHDVWVRGLVRNGANLVKVETGAGLREIEYLQEKYEALVIRLSMGRPEFRPEEIPINLNADVDYTGGQPVLDYLVTLNDRAYPLSFISMGNPHAVLFIREQVAGFPLDEIGPLVENSPVFPSRTNFEVVRVIDRANVEARVWERGAGETLACGTGACAVAVIARQHGYTCDRIDIKLPGGVLTVEWDGTGEVYLSGPAEIVFTGEWIISEKE
jgi:diaminopimelate epimerase